MEKLTEKHPQETAYILRITKMLSEGKVKEAIAYYKEDTERQPDLETAITALEKLLDILTEGAYTLVYSMREHTDTSGSESGKYIADKYFQELNAVINELQDYKLGNNSPGDQEIMTEMMKDIPSPISGLDLKDNDD